MYYNLSKPQESIYYMSRFSEEGVANIAGDVFFNFSVSIIEAKEAISDFLNKCDVMHTRIFYVDGKPMQRIFKDYEYNNIPVLRFKSYNDYYSWAKMEAQKPIKIDECLYRIFLIDIIGKVGLFSVTHHIISDATSFAYIGKYVTRYLKGERNITIYPYLDYILSEKEYESTKRYEKDRLFWIEELKNFETNYFSNKEVACTHSNRLFFILNKDLCDRIKTYCKAHSISEYALFFSALAIKYFKTTQKEDFFIGTPILNRYHNKEENMLGVFVNTVPVRINIKNDDSFSSFCDKTMDKILSCFRHQKYHYTQLLKNVSQESNNKTKLFDVLLSFWNVKTHNESNAEWFSCCNQLESLQIHIDDRKNENRYHIHYDYQTEKFTQEDIDRLHTHFCNLIEDALKNPDKKICDLEMISSDEKQKILYDFNDTDHSYSIPDSSTIFSLFEKTAKENKEKFCIKTSDKSITFGELLNISENLDMAIRHITKDKKSIIAVIAERSVEMYASIYGTVRGGNAYLPIDPEYPQERIDYIINNSGASAVLAQGKFIHLAKGTPCINVTEFLNNLCEKIAETPICAAQPDDTAYVIYTSGSTGNPKGAKISHRSIVNRIMWMHDKYPLCSDDVILQKTPYTFDVSVWELFWWGMCGASLCASKPGEHFLPARILDEVYNNKVTHLHFVPSVFELFLNYLEAHTEERNKFNSVKYVFLSGEALSANLVQRFYKLYDYNNVSLHNLYGPTECAVDVTYYDCIPADIDPVPIGKPIYNTQMYVVDKYMKPVPIGVTGELCIAGANVGQGYLNNPELSAEKFIPNPFGIGLLYKTGDNAYWRDDGQLIFCGRIDGQIKLNGQRIEIGEIEATISEISGVDSVVVIVKNTNAKDILVAFYTGKEESGSQIKDACLKTLPRYMVPGVFVHLDALPLNQSGKLNRKVLKEYAVESSQSYEQEEPLSEDERLICKIFKSVLGVNTVGRNSDFFDLGGTSLSMISALSENVLTKISSSEFIRNSTPAKLAVILQKNSMKAYDFLEPLYVSEGSEQVLLLIPYAGGGPEAYSNFVTPFKSKNKQTSVYFLRYLHSIQECNKAAEEISKVLVGKEIYVYSHCVGSAVALQILKHLEEQGRPVKYYLAGASIPPSRPTKKNIWNLVPNIVLKMVLSKAGAKLDGLSDDSIDILLKQFRKDTDFANISYFEFEEKIKTPVSLVINKKDMFTINYNKAEKIWQKYAVNTNNIYFISSSSHYFQSDNTEDLMEIIQYII